MEGTRLRHRRVAAKIGRKATFVEHLIAHFVGSHRQRDLPRREESQRPRMVALARLGLRYCLDKIDGVRLLIVAAPSERVGPICEVEDQVEAAAFLGERSANPF